MGGGRKEQQHQDAMAPPQKPAPGKKLADEAGAPSAGGAAVPKQGAPIKGQAKTESAAGTAAASEPGAPIIELNEKTKAALAGHMQGEGEDDILDSAFCMVCTDHTFGDAVAVTASCGHPFHPKCIEDAMKREKSKCPCGAAFPPDKEPVVPFAPMLKRIVNKAKVRCPQGCGEVTSFGNLHQHIHNAAGCPNTPYRCSNVGCGVLFLRKDKDAHLGNCPHRLVPCELCEQHIKAGELQQHKAEQCLRRQVRCPHCQGEHLFCDTEEHMRRCSGGVSMKNITELKDMMAQQQQTVSQLLSRVTQQQQTIERQQREIAELRPLRPLACQGREPAARAAVEQEREQSLAELCHLDEQQTQRVPGLAEARQEMLLREARVAIEQEREQCMTELRRIERQQEEAIWQRERAALPQRLNVREATSYEGEYSLRPERINGAAVWGTRSHRIYRSREGHWALAHEADGPQRNRGLFRLTSQPGSPAPLNTRGWEWCRINSSGQQHCDMSRADGWVVDDRCPVSVTAL